MRRGYQLLASLLFAADGRASRADGGGESDVDDVELRWGRFCSRATSLELGKMGSCSLVDESRLSLH